MNKLHSMVLFGLIILPGLALAESQDATIIMPAPQTHYLIEGNILKECSTQNTGQQYDPDSKNGFTCRAPGTVQLDLIAPKVDTVTIRIDGIKEDGSGETVRNMSLPGALEGEHLKVILFQNQEFTPQGEDYLIGENGLMGRAFRHYEMNATYQNGVVTGDRGNLLLISNKQHPVFYVDYGWADISGNADNTALCNGGTVTYQVTALPDREVLMVLIDEDTGQIIKDETIKTDAGGKVEYTIGEFAIGKYRLKGYFGRAGQKMGMADLEKDFTNNESLVGFNEGTHLDTTGCGPMIHEVPSEAHNNNQNIAELPENNNNNRNIAELPKNNNNNASMCSRNNGQAIQGSCTPPYLGRYNLICGGRGGFGGIRNQGGEFTDSFYAYLEHGSSCNVPVSDPDSRLSRVSTGRMQVVAIPASSIEDDLARKKIAVRAKSIQYWCQKDSSQSISELVGKLTWTFTGCSDGFEAGKSFTSLGSSVGPGLVLRFDEVKAEKVCGKKNPSQFGVNYPVIAYVIDTLAVLKDADRLYLEDYKSDRASICADFDDSSVKEEDLFGAPGVLELAKTYAAQSTHQCTVNCDNDPVSLTFMTPQSPLIYLTSGTGETYTVTLTNQTGKVHFASPESTSGNSEHGISWKVSTDRSGRLSVVQKNGEDRPLGHLFYEFLTDPLHKFSRPKQGYVIRYDHLENFLRNDLLEKLGLSKEQKEDYIRDMLPRLGKNNFYFIGFLDNKEWSDTIGLSVQPRVNELKRIMLYFEPRESFSEASAPDLSSVKFEEKKYNSSLLEIGGYVATASK